MHDHQQLTHVRPEHDVLPADVPLRRQHDRGVVQGLIRQVAQYRTVDHVRERKVPQRHRDGLACGRDIRPRVEFQRRIHPQWPEIVDQQTPNECMAALAWSTQPAIFAGSSVASLTPTEMPGFRSARDE